MEHSALFKALRAAKGFTQHKIASELNISQQAYSQKEKNPNNLTLEELNKISKIYGTDPPTPLSGDINKILPFLNK